LRKQNAPSGRKNGGERYKEQRENLGLTLELLYGDLEEILPYRETLRLSLPLSLSLSVELAT